MSEQAPKWRFSRSHSEAYKRCPRYYQKAYIEGGTGIEPAALSMGLSRGSLGHEILAQYLNHVRKGTETPEILREIFAKAFFDFKNKALDRTLEDIDTSMLEWEIDRQCALVEGMCRAWIKYRLPMILDIYEIVATEVEREIELSPDVVLMTRIDNELRHKQTGEYAALEFKFTKANRSDYFDSWRYATQTAAHLIALEEIHGGRASSVLMEFLMVGTVRSDEKSGMDIYYSPLVRGYRLPANPPLQPDDIYGHESKLGIKKGWITFNVWEEVLQGKPAWMSNMEYWVEAVLPPEKAREQFVTREIFRHEDEMEAWKKRVVAQQRRLYTGVQMLQDKATEDQALDVFFPGNFDESCYSNKYFRPCPFLPVCYGELGTDPVESGKFVRRTPHHEREFEV